MAWGRNIIISSLPLLGTLAAVILTIVVLVGGTKNTSVLKDLYFFKLDLSHVTSAAITGLDDLDITGIATAAIDTVLRSILADIGLSEFYTASLWGYCGGQVNSTTNATDVDFCSHPKAMWWLNVTEILNERLNSTAVQISLPSDLTEYDGTIEAASKAMFVCYFISVVVLFIALFAGCFAFRSRGAGCCAALITLVGFLASLLASGIATGLYIAIRNIVNKNANEYGIAASVGHTMYGLSWGATAASLWAVVWWVLTICCGSTRKAYEPEKQPFIGYVPHDTRY